VKLFALPEGVFYLFPPFNIPLQVFAYALFPEKNIARTREDHERDLGEHEQDLVMVGDCQAIAFSHQDERSPEYRRKDIDKDRSSEKFPERGRSRLGGYEEEGGETEEEGDNECPYPEPDVVR